MSPSQYLSQKIPLADYLEHHLNHNVYRLPLQISCPLHTDKKPSMRLYAPKEKDGFCFSCGKSYTSFQMHQSLYDLSYRETMEQLAEMFEIDLSMYNKDKEVKRYLSDSTIAPLVIDCVAHIKTIPNKLPQNFDRLAYKIHKAIKTNNTSCLKLKKEQA